MEDKKAEKLRGFWITESDTVKRKDEIPIRLQTSIQEVCLFLTSVRPHRNKQRQKQALMSQTHPERLVQRGWRGQAAVRSTWPPPPLTAHCRRSQLRSVFCWQTPEFGFYLYGTAPSTLSLLLKTQSPGARKPDVAQKSVIKRQRHAH